MHWELWSKEPERAGRFYADVFDWKISHVEEMNYRFVDTGSGGGINGGIMKPQEGSWPGNMAFYVDVDDLDAYRLRVEEAGGTTVVGRMAVGEMGAIGLFSDPDGRVFGMWERRS